MRLISELSLALGLGFVGMGVSAWHAGHRVETRASLGFSDFLPASKWKEAARLAQERAAPILVYIGMAGDDAAALEGAFSGDPVIQEALESFVPVSAFLDGSPDDRALAAALGAVAAPDFLILAAEDLEPAVIQRLDTVTGSAFERFGLASELLRFASGVERLESTDATDPSKETESGVNGFRARLAQLERIVESFQPPSPADVETPLDDFLSTETNERLRYYGWSWLASWLERCARRASDAGGDYLGVSSSRWETRLRETTRRAWISCPDDRLFPFGGLLIQRYARAPRDLDSLDRAFMGAVIRTLSNSPGSDEFPGKDWLAEARAALPPK